MYEGRLDGKRVAVKKPVLSTSEDLDKFHKELQLLWSVPLPLSRSVCFDGSSCFSFCHFFIQIASGGSLLVINTDDNGCLCFSNGQILFP